MHGNQPPHSRIQPNTNRLCSESGRVYFRFYYKNKLKICKDIFENSLGLVSENRMETFVTRLFENLEDVKKRNRIKVRNGS